MELCRRHNVVYDSEVCPACELDRLEDKYAKLLDKVDVMEDELERLRGE